MNKEQEKVQEVTTEDIQKAFDEQQQQEEKSDPLIQEFPAEDVLGTLALRGMERREQRDAHIKSTRKNSYGNRWGQGKGMTSKRERRLNRASISSSLTQGGEAGVATQIIQFGKNRLLFGEYDAEVARLINGYAASKGLSIKTVEENFYKKLLRAQAYVREIEESFPGEITSQEQFNRYSSVVTELKRKNSWGDLNSVEEIQLNYLTKRLNAFINKQEKEAQLKEERERVVEVI